ncbi:hypothetical protein X755_19830 [Mesorhizobium sp. LNJC405B00]|nr:hypothetical protein X755_19830 [Mesorhizobium sp. LNJC405B00]
MGPDIRLVSLTAANRAVVAALQLAAVGMKRHAASIALPVSSKKGPTRTGK